MKRWLPMLLLAAGLVGLVGTAHAQSATPLSVPSISLTVGGGEGGPAPVANSVKLLLLMTLLTLAPSILMSMTAFARILIVFSFLRQAIGAQGVPGNQTLAALALFMTMFVMSPVVEKIKVDAYDPLVAEQIDQPTALKNAWVPLRGFMLKHTREKDLELFVSASGAKRPNTIDDLKVAQVVPAFMISELTTAFSMGFLIYVPFLVIDMVISSVLTAMGMMMLPPAMIALPFKIVLFVLVDGWNLVVASLLRSFG